MQTRTVALANSALRNVRTFSSVGKIQEVVVFVAGTNRKHMIFDLCSKVFTPTNALIGRTRCSRLGEFDFASLGN